MLGARAVAFAGVPGTPAAASTIVDVSLEFVAQIAFTGLGAGVADPAEARCAGCGPCRDRAGRRRNSGGGFVGRPAARIWSNRSPRREHSAVIGSTGPPRAPPRSMPPSALIYRRRIRLSANFILHLVCWIAATLEAWLALRFAGAPLGFGVVLVIEGLLYAIRSVAFAVPNAVGVQEGAYIMLGGSFGLTPEMALALSLLKRARDLGARTAGARRVPASRRRPPVAPRCGARIEVTAAPAASASSSLVLRRGKSSRLGLVLALLALLAQIAGTRTPSSGAGRFGKWRRQTRHRLRRACPVLGAE